eukprot:SAG31_NODE_204_length_20414_cov_19.143392_7_plen_109_part_00
MAEDSESTTCTDSDLLGVEFGELRRPKGVFVYDGTVYVADEMNHRVTQTTVADDNVIDAIRGNSVADLHSNMTTAWLAGAQPRPSRSHLPCIVAAVLCRFMAVVEPIR